MKVLPFTVALLASSNFVVSDSSSEYLASVLTTGEVTWQLVTYPSNYTATSASDVTFTDITDSPDELGAWYGLDMDGTPTLTGRVYGDNMYGYLNTGTAPEGGDYPGGCCADTLRVFGRDDEGAYTDINLLETFQTMFDGISDTDSENGWNYAYANHMFDMTTIDGVDAAIIDVVYTDPLLSSMKVDAVVLLNPATGDIIQTADGDDFFSWYRTLGTTSTTSTDSIYKIFFDNESDEQYHQNGLNRFQTSSGVWILAATFRQHGEAILIKDPFTYTTAEGGGTILQRFGSPDHTFGLSSTAGAIEAMHNIYYTAYPDGTETLSVFVNQQEDEDQSQCFEFHLNLVEEPTTDYNDTVFDTTYTSAELSYSTGSWGGCRPVGPGVWLVGNKGIDAVDTTTAAKIKALNDNNNQNETLVWNQTVNRPGGDDDSSSNVYDSFVFVTI